MTLYNKIWNLFFNKVSFLIKKWKNIKMIQKNKLFCFPTSNLIGTLPLKCIERKSKNGKSHLKKEDQHPLLQKNKTNEQGEKVITFIEGMK